MSSWADEMGSHKMDLIFSKYFDWILLNIIIFIVYDVYNEFLSCLTSWLNIPNIFNHHRGLTDSPSACGGFQYFSTLDT